MLCAIREDAVTISRSRIRWRASIAYIRRPGCRYTIRGWNIRDAAFVLRTFQQLVRGRHHSQVGKRVIDPLRVGAARGGEEENRSLPILPWIRQRDRPQRHRIPLLEEKTHSASQ